ncbi:type I-E CRISPR-associated protein Cas7/Cse4/CasC [Streptomyces violascens]|uniref:type I-E CRISPR-associated protein Cas7/Cse4/CasC n=1 Tax=Streptomyces violascens TaxID=67381 RepID=UPI003686A5AC
MTARHIDLHVLQDLPAHCLNRGEYDEPKSLLIGNTLRPALSSQCVKHAHRHAVEDRLGEPAARTRLLPHRLATALRAAHWPKELAQFAAEQVPRSATREGLDLKDADRTLAMLLLPAATILDDLVTLCTTHRPALEAGLATETARAAAGKAKGTAAYLPTAQVVRLLATRTASINLFGRFLAGVPDAKVAGAVQMAWSFTTHASDLQPDFYTAVEDWAREQDSGGAHLDTAYLAAGVYYRYATINLTELTANTKSAAKAIGLLGLFTEVFLTTLPRAKNTSTAPHTLPDLAHYAVRDRRPVSYAAAFHQPVAADPRGGYLAPSRQALSQHAGTLNQLLGTRHLVAHGYTSQATDPVDHLGDRHATFDDLIDAVMTAAAAPPTPCRTYHQSA